MNVNDVRTLIQTKIDEGNALIVQSAEATFTPGLKHEFWVANREVAMTASAAVAALKEVLAEIPEEATTNA